MPRPFRRAREVLKQRLVYDGDAGARVFEVVAVVVRGQQRVDHRDDAARAARPEPGPDELRAVRQRDENSVFDLDTQLAQSAARAVRPSHRVRVCESLVAEVKTSLVLAPFLDVVVEEVVAHSEAFGELDIHCGDGGGIFSDLSPNLKE